MRYGSVCSGIEAATVAWHPLGWEPAYFSEIDKFPRAVLEHHYPDVPLHGDFTTIEEKQYGSIDLLVGGTPCQSFSIAGLRKGLDDERGNLALEFLRLAKREWPTWLVWENVPGVLSSGGGRDFGALLGGLVELGYGFAYRVLDAQYFGVAQRRRRVFVVGYSGDWRPAAAVLFERQSLCGHPAPVRGQGEGFAADVAPSLTGSGRGVERAGESRGQDPVIAFGGNRTSGSIDVAAALNHKHYRDDFESETLLVSNTIAFQSNANGGDIMAAGNEVSPSVRIGSSGGGQPPAVAFKPSHYTRGKDGAPSEITPPLSADADKGDQEPIVIAERGRADGSSLECRQDGTSDALMTPSGGRGGMGIGALCHQMQVRRLTPRECERLQGFADDYTRIPWRGKGPEGCPDGPRYKALGNSMAVPVMRWVGERINLVEAIMEAEHGL